MKIKKGDKVKVLSGKDKGKESVVLAVIKKADKVLVEGVNMVTRFEKKSEKSKGGISKGEAPIYVCKVMVINEVKEVKKTKKSTVK